MESLLSPGSTSALTLAKLIAHLGEESGANAQRVYLPAGKAELQVPGLAAPGSLQVSEGSGLTRCRGSGLSQG